MQVLHSSFSIQYTRLKVEIGLLSRIIAVLFVSIISLPCLAQNKNTTHYTDTLNINLQQAEERFLDSNLQLLAQYYNIQSNKAIVEQTRKWDNPQLSTSQNLYNRSEGWFKHNTSTTDPQGEIYGDLEQVIKTAGKRRKLVDMAKTNVNLAEWQFNATMRALRLQLINDFYNIIQLEGNTALFNENINILRNLQKGMKTAFEQGNVSRSDYLRIQSLVVGLEQNITDNDKAIEDAEADLRTILRCTSKIYIHPVAPETVNTVLPENSIVSLMDSAMIHNTDYQSEVYTLQLQRQNLSYQKAVPYPDLQIGADFDQHASYTPDYWGLNISFDLPLWDRNQGNIKSAKFQVKQEEANMAEINNKLENDVMDAYRKLMLSLQLNSTDNRQFYKDYYDTYKNKTDAFSKRLISLLDFLDFFSDYENTRQQELQHTFNLHMDIANLNDVVGIDVVKQNN